MIIKTWEMTTEQLVTTMAGELSAMARYRGDLAATVNKATREHIGLKYVAAWNAYWDCKAAWKIHKA